MGARAVAPLPRKRRGRSHRNSRDSDPSSGSGRHARTCDPLPDPDPTERPALVSSGLATGGSDRVPIETKRSSFVLTERFRRSERVEVDPEVTARVRALYEGGRYLDAFEAARAGGPLQAWRGAEAL